MKKHLLLMPVLGLCLAAHANPEAGMDRLLALSLEDLMATKVKISTSTEQMLTKAPSVVSIITAEDIKATGAANLTEILQSMPGVYIKQNLFGFKPLITFRGATGTHTLLMVNGAPIKDLVWTPGIFWKGLPTSMIERVEIIRGPGSALFGSDASAGVINVITKTAGRIQQSEGGLRTGSFDTQAGWIQHGAQWNGFDVNFTAEVSQTDGHRPFIAKDRIGTSPDNAHYGWENQDFRLSIGKGSWRLLADHMRHNDVEIGLTGAAVLDPRTRANDSQTSLALLYSNEAFATDWGANFELRYRDMQYSSGNGFWERPPGFVPANFNQLDSAERRWNFEASGLYNGFRNHSLRVGGGEVWQDLYFVRQLINGVAKNFAPERARRNNYLFVQDVWTIAGDWELTAGARYDHYSDFGGTVNPRLALVWQSTDRLTTKLMYGRAFRVPTYLELYSETSANAPNPSLTPERSQTWDLSFSYLASKDLKLGIDFYQFARSNVIADEKTPPYQFKNLDGYTTHGVELEAQWQATQSLRVSGNATYRAEIDSPLRDYSIPPQKVYLRADWAFTPKWNWNLQATRIGNRPPAAGDTRAPLHAYTLLDTTIRYFHDRSWEFAASVRNLNSVDAREYSSSRIPDNLPLPGRSLYAELRHKF